MTTTHSNAGRRRPGRAERRAVNGILLLDKPTGITSNAALQQAKRLFNAAKAGHTGSLDPLASGLLPLCFGHATKLSGYLLDADKTYRFTCQLGATTDTGDAEGSVVERRPLPELDSGRVTAALNGLVGDIEQLPPMYSALKQNGKRLYELARQGIEVERQPRPITVYELRLLTLDADSGRLECRVRCSKGTYVRTLAEDIGVALGCGGFVAALRREGVAPYDLTQAVSLDELTDLARQDGQFAALDAKLLTPDSALQHWPSLRLDDTLAFYLRSGNPVRVSPAPAGGWVRLYDGRGQFIGLGEMLADGRVAPRRLFG